VTPGGKNVIDFSKERIHMRGKAHLLVIAFPLAAAMIVGGAMFLSAPAVTAESEACADDGEQPPGVPTTNAGVPPTTTPATLEELRVSVPTAGDSIREVVTDPIWVMNTTATDVPMVPPPPPPPGALETLLIRSVSRQQILTSCGLEWTTEVVLSNGGTINLAPNAVSVRLEQETSKETLESTIWLVATY
jgi:hypothetical protein